MEYKTEELYTAVESIEKELRFLRLKNLIVVIGSTWLLYNAIVVLGRFDIPRIFYPLFAVPPLLNAIIWAYWGVLSSFPFRGIFPFKPDYDDFDDRQESRGNIFRRYDSSIFSIKRIQKQSRIINYLAALQFLFLALLWVMTIIPRFE